MAFHEVRLPTALALGAMGGPERRTEIVPLGSGFEHRNQLWARSRRKWNIGYGIKSFAQLEQIVAFFEERRGRFHGFRFRDRLDYRSAAAGQPITAEDQVIGIGDGTTTSFQVTKQYGAGGTAFVREIEKLVSGTVVVAVDGTPMVSGSDFGVLHNTGVINFQPGSIPGNGDVVTAGFEFDVPVRFDTDHLEVDLAAFEAGAVPSIPIVEIFL